jgi:hypothetical protein
MTVSDDRVEKSPSIFPNSPSNRHGFSPAIRWAKSFVFNMVRKGDSNPHEVAFASPSSGRVQKTKWLYLQGLWEFGEFHEFSICPCFYWSFFK